LLSAIGVILALQWLFYRTSLGRAFRATSDNPVTASLMGIKPQRVFAQATGIAMVVVARNFQPTSSSPPPASTSTCWETSPSRSMTSRSDLDDKAFVYK
jgi:hypothetical protein